MAKYQGQVFKTYDGKYGESFRLEDNPVYFNLDRGVSAPPAGANVSFEAEINKSGKGAAVQGPVEIVQRSSPASSGGSSGGGGSRQEAIQYQSARKDALQFVDILLRTEAVKLPASVANRVSLLEALLDKYTAEFYEDIDGLGALERAQEAELAAQEAAEEPAVPKSKAAAKKKRVVEDDDEDDDTDEG